MVAAAFQRAAKRILARTGQDAFLRGVSAGKVNIEHGVQIQDQETGLITPKDVATIMLDFAPKKGDTLVHPDGNFRLDRLLEDNGVTRRFIVVKG